LENLTHPSELSWSLSTVRRQTRFLVVSGLTLPGDSRFVVSHQPRTGQSRCIAARAKTNLPLMIQRGLVRSRLTLLRNFLRCPAKGRARPNPMGLRCVWVIALWPGACSHRRWAGHFLRSSAALRFLVAPRAASGGSGGYHVGVHQNTGEALGAGRRLAGRFRL
jgi:hypothetical protein